ncbi:hypothetical protein EYF80_020424 [Liparis tanakae]|uniref:Uncharacterized protein n=1 Tax=Liparis tanakae TaxID=230148 RepID=A0A4Z2HWR5_9TELE|nr:hypothetical protein EYF80_020424 [Liparis tanakae]
MILQKEKEILVTYLLMELTLGTLSLSHTLSARSRSRISQANMGYAAEVSLSKKPPLHAARPDPGARSDSLGCERRISPAGINWSLTFVRICFPHTCWISMVKLEDCRGPGAVQLGGFKKKATRTPRLSRPPHWSTGEKKWRQNWESETGSLPMGTGHRTGFALASPKTRGGKRQRWSSFPQPLVHTESPQPAGETDSNFHPKM